MSPEEADPVFGIDGQRSSAPMRGPAPFLPRNEPMLRQQCTAHARAQRRESELPCRSSRQRRRQRRASASAETRPGGVSAVSPRNERRDSLCDHDAQALWDPGCRRWARGPDRGGRPPRGATLRLLLGHFSLFAFPSLRLSLSHPLACRVSLPPSGVQHPLVFISKGSANRSIVFGT